MLPRALCSLLLVFLLTSRPLAAQGPPPPAPEPLNAPQTPAATAKPTYAQEPYVLQQLTTVYSYRADGTGYRELTVAARIQSDAALRTLGVLQVSFASASERVELHYARARHPDGSVTDTALNAALEQPAPVTREAPFYSDLKQKELPITGLHVGDTLEWQARIVRTAAEAPNQFWGSESFFAEGIALSEDVELHIPATKRVIIWTNPTAGATPSDVTTNGERVLHWHHISTKPTVGPAAEAAKTAAKTHLLTPAEELDATEGKLPSIAFTTFADWAAVGDWYRQLATSRALPDATIQAKAAELTAGLTTDEARARALYNYVSLQIRYIGVAFGIGRFQPHLASDVLSNQYGDCKDKHTLLSALLAAVHIPSDAVLIGDGVRFNPDVPSPEAFNHLITLAHIDGKPVWLDTTAEIGPFQVLMPSIRDKSALVIPASTPAAIEKTPPLPPYKPYSTYVVTGTLDKDLTSDSSITSTYRDDDELGLRAVLRQVSPGQYNEFVQALMTNMGFGGTTSEGSIANVADTAQPLVIAFHYHRVRNPDWGADRITANFAPISLPFFTDQQPPVATINLGLARTESSTLDLTLPLHFTAELPEAVHVHKPFATCDVTYRLDSSKPQAVLHAERNIAILQSKLPVTTWPAYKSWYQDCGVGTYPYLQLIRGTGAATSKDAKASDPVPTVSNAAAEKLIEQASEAIRATQTDKALELLDKARAIAPTQRNLWGTYGYRAYMLGDPTEAIEDYTREIQYHPEQTWVYAPLAEELAHKNKPDEAIAACRKGVAIDPANSRLQLMFLSLLEQQNRNPEAATAGTAALQAVPAEDEFRPNLILLTTTAQVAIGSYAQAAPLLTEMLKKADKPGMQNDAAYVLAETGLELPTAEAASRASLEGLSAETRSWTLDESPQTLKQQSSLLAASWDTLGYILFRAKKLAEARTYIEASWRARQSPEVGLHLGDILLAQGDPTAALTTYQMAYAALPSNREMRKGKLIVTVSPGSKLLADKLTDAIARAQKAGGKSPFTEKKSDKLPDAFAALQKLRTVTLGPTKGYNASLEYRLLLSRGKVDLIHAVTGTASPDTATLLRNTTAFAAFTPANADAKIVLTGFVNCSTETCDFVIEP
jgi:transglutaminase-like putative cysteine protease/tetratricopeptide (TPR) repeat protein